MRQAAAGALVLALCLVAARAPIAQTASGEAARRQAYDALLDVDVRDGLVYYRALKADRAKLDGYVASLAAVPVRTLPRDEQVSLWLNAYNAIVLQTVLNHYPIATRVKTYPPHSIRQIPGAFERLTHRVGGQTVTLDQIEQTILPAFHDPRVYLALGRGSIGGGRLRSEAFAPDRLEAQLTSVASECVTRPQCWQVDAETNTVSVSSIFSWRDKDFIAAYAGAAAPAFASRSLIERAVLAFVDPSLLTTEREFLGKNQFKVAFTPFDWNLNDLTGRGGR